MKTARTLWAAMWLFVGVMIAAVLLPLFLMTFGVVFGIPSALKGGRYWQRAWIGFDKWCSRLGKSKVYRCKPVFYFRSIDLLVSWWLHQIEHNHVENSIDFSVGCCCSKGHEE